MAGHIETAGRVDWNTPANIIDVVKKVFGGDIRLDPCSNETSVVGAAMQYVLPFHDGLTDSWYYDTIFVNPPYGRCWMHPVTKQFLPPSIATIDEFLDLPIEIGRLYDWSKNKYKLKTQAASEAGYRSSTIAHWVKRAVQATMDGAEIIMLIPSAVGTKHWQNLIFKKADAVNFLKGRIHFSSGGPAPMDCALVYFGKNVDKFIEETAVLGTAVLLRECKIECI